MGGKWCVPGCSGCYPSPAAIHVAVPLPGIDIPLFSTNCDCFETTFLGPADNLDRIRVKEDQVEPIIEPGVEERLNDFQREMLGMLAAGTQVTSRFCEEHFGVSRDSTSRDFKELIELGLASRIGAGRSTKGPSEWDAVCQFDCRGRAAG